jgi:hypothetical protein
MRRIRSGGFNACRRRSDSADSASMLTKGDAVSRVGSRHLARSNIQAGTSSPRSAAEPPNVRRKTTLSACRPPRESPLASRTTDANDKALLAKRCLVDVLKPCCIMAGDRTRALTARHPIRPTSPRSRSTWQPNPGRRSTYRRGDAVQTTGTSSRHHNGNRQDNAPSEVAVQNNAIHTIVAAAQQILIEVAQPVCHGMIHRVLPNTGIDGTPRNRLHGLRRMLDRFIRQANDARCPGPWLCRNTTAPSGRIFPSNAWGYYSHYMLAVECNVPCLARLRMSQEPSTDNLPPLTPEQIAEGKRLAFATGLGFV